MGGARSTNGGVSVTPSSVIEAPVVLCSVSLWLVWVNVLSACALNTRYILKCGYILRPYWDIFRQYHIKNKIHCTVRLSVILVQMLVIITVLYFILSSLCCSFTLFICWPAYSVVCVACWIYWFLGRTNRLLSLIRHGPHRKRRF
jgi:hypothetical protein